MVVWLPLSARFSRLGGFVDLWLELAKDRTILAIPSALKRLLKGDVPPSTFSTLGRLFGVG